MPCYSKVSWLRSKAVFLTMLRGLIEEASGRVRARGTHEHVGTCQMSFLCPDRFRRNISRQAGNYLFHGRGPATQAGCRSLDLERWTLPGKLL